MSHPIGQGHGQEGSYGGLPKEYADPALAAVVIVPVPFDMTTTYQHGAQKGPAALIEASRNMELYDIETDSSPYEIGIYTAPAIETASSEEMLKRVYEQTKEQIEKGKFVVTLGGEHSISYAPIKAHSEKYPGISILQVDAHADLHPAYEGNVLSHASVMARVRELPDISSIVAVGIRSMSQEEGEVVDHERTIFGHQIDEEGKWIDRAVDLLSDQVYITFDLDGFDSSLMPSTGTPEPGGLFWNQAMKLLRAVAHKKNIVGFDVVELCPNATNLAPDYLAAKLVYKIISYQNYYHPKV